MATPTLPVFRVVLFHTEANGKRLLRRSVIPTELLKSIHNIIFFLGSPLTNLEEVLIAASKDKGGIEKANLIKILQRQEAAHQLELQKWYNLLGTAAGLLKQVKFIKYIKFHSRKSIKFLANPLIFNLL